MNFPKWMGAALACLFAGAVHAAPRTASTIAGTGEAGFDGDSGPATAARLNDPYGIAKGPDGALYICDMKNHRIRKVGPDGLITTVAGCGEAGYSGDGGPAVQAKLNEPYEVRFDTSGNLYFVEMRNHLVRRVDVKTGMISTVAGLGEPGFSGDGGPARKARLRQPHSIQLSPDGTAIYICDIGNHRVRKVHLKTGLISTFAGTGEKQPTPDGGRFQEVPLYGPRAIDFDRAGNLWLALREGNAVYRLDLAAGTIHHVAGTGKKGFTGNGGPAREAALSGPKGLSVGPDGNVYIADTESHTIRMIDTKRGTMELVAGTGRRGDGPDGMASHCAMARPHGVFVDRDGSIYVGDSENHRVRVIRAGVVRR